MENQSAFFVQIDRISKNYSFSLDFVICWTRKGAQMKIAMIEMCILVKDVFDSGLFINKAIDPTPKDITYGS